MLTKVTGFTLVEVVIAMVVAAILVTVSLPSYRFHVFKSRRAAAQGCLLELGQLMHRFYSANFTFNVDIDADGTVEGATETLTGQCVTDLAKVYTLSLQSATQTAYTLRATPKNAQVGDGYMELTQAEKRWDKNNDNDAIDAGEDNWSK